MDSIVKRIRKEVESPKGLHETTSKKSIDKDSERNHTKKAIQELQQEVIRLQQQVEFLKKIQMLKVLEENEE